MKKSKFIEAIKASCGSGGCDIKEYLLPQGGTRENFLREAEKSEKATKKANEKE